MMNSFAPSASFAVKPETEILFRRRWPKSTLALDIAGMNAQNLALAYRALRASAPRRLAKSPYFVCHDGLTSGSGVSNRREEHIAVALVALRRRWPLPSGNAFQLIDYQVPLKSKRSDAGVGKIDMFGLTDGGRIVVVELKVKGQSGGDSDPPPTALLEGLRYSAIVVANQERLRDEIAQRFDRAITSEPPIVLILGEAAWWKAWTTAAPTARAEMDDLGRRLFERLGVPIYFGKLDDCVLEYGTRRTPPILRAIPQIAYVGHVQ